MLECMLNLKSNHETLQVPVGRPDGPTGGCRGLPDHTVRGEGCFSGGGVTDVPSLGLCAVRHSRQESDSAAQGPPPHPEAQGGRGCQELIFLLLYSEPVDAICPVSPISFPAVFHVGSDTSEKKFT